MSMNVRDSQPTQAQGHSVTTIADFGGINYYVDPEPAKVIAFQPPGPSYGFVSSLKPDLRPCNVVWKEDESDIVNISKDLDSFSASYDDVLTSAFLDGETSRRHRIAIDFDCLQ